MYPYQVVTEFCSDIGQHFASITRTHHLDCLAEAGRLSSRIVQVEMRKTQTYNWLFVYIVSLQHLSYYPSVLCLYPQVADAEQVSSMDRKGHVLSLGCPRTESEEKMNLVTP